MAGIEKRAVDGGITRIKLMDGNQNEHAFRCDQFFALNAPFRWSAVADFISDRNSTVNVCVRTSDAIPYGGCGPRPDQAAIINEPRSLLDEEADRLGIFGERRKMAHWLKARIKRANRHQYIEDQIRESLCTGTIPFHLLSKEESKKIVSEIGRRSKIRKTLKAKARQKRQEQCRVKSLTALDEDGFTEAVKSLSRQIEAAKTL